MRLTYRIFFICIIIFVIIVIILRTSLKPLPGATFKIYSVDKLGFIYRTEPHCGFLFSCSYSYYFLGEHISNFNLIGDGHCNIAKGRFLYSNGYKLDFNEYSKIEDTDFIKSETGDLYNNCGTFKFDLDKSSTRIINSSCVEDNNAIYCYSRKLKELVPSNTVFLNEYFAKTDKNIWFLPQQRIVSGIDLKTTKYIGKNKTGIYFLKDKNGLYKYSWSNDEKALERISTLPSDIIYETDNGLL